MNKRLFVVGIRLLFAAVAIVAILVQMLYVSQYSPHFDPVNFFSYFTILSNVFVSIVFVIGAYRLARGQLPSPVDDVLRGASVLYMAVTGIVYSLLLSGIDVDLSLTWVNMQLHYVMPIVVVFDWFYQPQRSKLSVQRIIPWLVFPALYLIYTLIRGSMIGWYPYPFLDPAKAGGYGGVLLYALGILVTLFIASYVLMRVGNIGRRHAAQNL